MARATFVKSARKDNPVVKKGEPYYWWKFRYGGMHYSKLPPRPSQLTGSPFLSAIYGALESLEDLKPPLDRESAAEALRFAAEEIEQAGTEQEDNLQNMPDGLQQGETGLMMEQRASDAAELAQNLNDFADQLDDLEGEIENREGHESLEDVEERVDGEVTHIVEEAQMLSYEGE